MAITSCSREKIQEFTIIPGYEGMASYVEAAKSDPDADLEELYREYVVDPYWEECAAGGEYRILAERAIANPIEDIDDLAKNVTTIAETEIEQIVVEALEKSADVLPGPHTTVCIYASDPQLSWGRMRGVRGFTAGTGKIWIQLSPEKDWLEWIPYTVAHEYHHSVWTENHFKWYKKSNLLNYLIFEGRADSFAHYLYPDKLASWTTAISIDEEERQWEELRENLEKTEQEQKRDFMFGNRIRSIPTWTGYTIGFHIVQLYIENHPNVSIEEWTAMGADELFKESGYDSDS